MEHLRQAGKPADIASELHGLGANLQKQQRLAEAETCFREALALRDTLAAAKPPQASAWQLANTKSFLGACLTARQRFAEALSLLQAGYDGLKKDEAAIPAAERGRRLAEAAERLAEHFTAVGEAAKAKEWKDKAEGHRKPAAPKK